MEIAWGVGYLLLLGLVVVLALPLVWLSNRFGGNKDGRAANIYFWVGLAVVGAVLFS